MTQKPRARHIIDAADPEPVPLDIDPAMVAFIIYKARQFDVKVPPVEPDPASNPTDDNEASILEDNPSDATEEELAAAIEQLSDDAVIDLIAMLWLGRGDFTTAEWQDARALAAERARGDTAAYMMGEPNLGDLLEAGFTDLGYALEDYEPA